MRAGRLPHHLTIETNTPVRSATGALVDSWSPSGFAWCSVDPATGGEVYRGQQLLATTTHIIGTRYQAGITPLVRFAWRPTPSSAIRYFYALAVRDLGERRRELVIEAKETVVA